MKFWTRATTATGLDIPADYQNISNCADIFTEAVYNELLPEMLAKPLAQPECATIQLLISDGKKYSSIMTGQSAKYVDSIWALDYNQLRTAWKENEMKWFLPKALGRKKLVRSLAIHAKDVSSVTAQNYSDICTMLEEVTKLRKDIQQSSSANIIGVLWKGENTDFDRLERAFNFTILIMQKDDFSTYSSAVSRLASVSSREAMKQELSAISGFLSETDKSAQEYHLDLSAQRSADDYFVAVAEAASRWGQNASALRERSALENSLCALEKLGLGCAVSSVRAGKVAEEDIVPAFEYSFARGVIYSVFRNTPGLAEFNHARIYRQTRHRLEWIPH